MDGAFDLTKNYPPLTYPTKIGAVTGAVKTLLVKAGSQGQEAGRRDPVNAKMAKFCMLSPWSR